MDDKRFFLVSGYCWSGSGAIVDLLKEYRCNIEPGIEFRLIKDPYGINDLYNALVVKRDPLNYDIAIKDYLWFVSSLNRKPTKLRHGLDYQNYFGNDLMKYTNEYINKLVKYQYTSSWWMFDLKKSPFEMFKFRFKRKFFGVVEESKMYFSDISKEAFCSITSEYIEKLLFSKMSNSNKNNIILDQAVSVFNALNEMQFLKNSKLIVVDRDPRDVYTELCKGGFLIGDQLMKSRDAMMYVEWHNAWRMNNHQLEKNNDILQLKFEDIIFRYDETVAKVESFLGLSSCDHTEIGKYLDVKKSKANVGIWKTFLTPDEIRIFDENLKEYYSPYEN